MAKAKKTNLIPLGDRVVLQRDAAEETTAGGIVLPDSAKDKPQRGTVVAVGDGHVKSDGSKLALSVKAGDLLAIRSAGAYGFVMSSNYNARPRPPEVIVDGATYHVVREREQIRDLFANENLLPE